jgi:6-phosphofructokinase 1
LSSKPEGRKKAYENLTKAGIDALVVIGGDGTLQEAYYSLNSIFQ